MGISAVKMLKKNSDILFKYSDIGLFHLFQHLGRSSFSFIKTILFQKITIQGAKSVKKVMPQTGFEPVTSLMADQSPNQYTKQSDRNNG